MQNNKQSKKKKNVNSNKQAAPVAKTIKKEKKDQKNHRATQNIKPAQITRDDSNKPICKLNLEGLCKLQMNNCNFSHDTRNYPCKYYHSTGDCKKGDKCDFSHSELTGEW